MSGRDSGEQWAPSTSASDRKSLLGKTTEDVFGESSVEARMRIKAGRWGWARPGVWVWSGGDSSSVGGFGGWRESSEGVQSIVGIMVWGYEELGASTFSVGRWKARVRAWKFCVSSLRRVDTSPRVTLTTYYSFKVPINLLHFCSDPVIASCVVISINKPLLISYIEDVRFFLYCKIRWLILGYLISH